MDSRQNELEQYIEKVMDVYDAAGLAVSIFTPQSTIYEKYFGWRDTANKIAADCNTVFGMASITKSFTALAIMQLAEQGKIDLDAAVAEYIPELTDKRIKISHLLTHSAGFYPLKRILITDVAKEMGILYQKDSSNYQELGYDEQLADKGLDLVCKRLNEQQNRLCEPGRYMSYCNDGYGILSEIIHRMGDRSSYGEYIRDHILLPLGMDRTFCEFIKPSEDENCTELYIHRNNVRECSRDFYDNAFVLMGGGAIKSTIRDMKKYVRMYMNEGKTDNGRIISRKAVQEMCSPRQEYHYGQWYGYGLAGKPVHNLTVWGHGGSLTGISNYMLWEPRLKIGILVFCNTTGVPSVRIAEKCIRWASGLKLESQDEKVVKEWDSAMRSKAAGTYESGEGIRVKLTDTDGKMELSIGNKVTPCRMLLPGILEVEEAVGTDDLMLMENDQGEIFGIRFRGRIIPKQSC